MDIYTLLYLQWVANKDLLYSTGSSAQCFVGAWMGREFGGKWMDVYVWLGPFAAHLKPSQCCSSITTLLIGYTPIQNKKFLKWEKNLNE